MIDDDKKDLGPFDDEYFDDDDDLSSDDRDLANSPPPPEDLDDDSFPDDVPAVSITKKKNTIIFVVGTIVLLYFFYQFFTSDDKNKKPVAKNEKEEMSEEFRETSSIPTLKNDMINATKLKKREEKNMDDLLVVAPPPPPLITPSSQFTSASPSAGGGGLPSLGSPSFPSSDNGRKVTIAERLFTNHSSKKSGAPNLPNLGGGGGGLYGGSNSSGYGGAGNGYAVVVSEDYKERIQAPMFLMQSPDTEYVRSKEVSASNNNGLSNRNFELGASSASSTDVTYVGNLNNVILEGKVIDAVLETAINTDLPDGRLRGIVSRDVYSERGNRILIPKGSRLLGSYGADVKFGIARVFIVWQRVIRPDGIDAIIDSGASDLLGRPGVYGKLDNRFFEIFGSSVLLSSISIAFAVAATESTSPPEAQSSSTATGVVENTDPLNEAITNEVTSLASNIQDVASELLETKPQVTVDQGTIIKVFVNKDVHFPDSFYSDDDRVKIIK